MVYRYLKAVYRFLYFVCNKAGYETRATAAPITFGTWFMQKVAGLNRAAYWPVHFTSNVSCPRNILIGIGTAPGLAHGCYIQGIGKIRIGDYTIIAPNVGLISANHDMTDSMKHVESSIDIGSYCWLGMNSVVLPGVRLGDHTVVGAGAVVTKSFPDGYCVLAGNPARIIKTIDPATCARPTNRYEYYGYIPKQRFAEYRRRRLTL